MKYTQCKLKKENTYQVAWIPNKFAIMDKILKIKDSAGKWISGWKVAFVGLTQEKSDNMDIHKLIRGHRKNTGDSLPKS